MASTIRKITIIYKASRSERLEELKQYFLRNLVEDPQDVTTFDTDVLEATEGLAALLANS